MCVCIYMYVYISIYILIYIYIYVYIYVYVYTYVAAIQRRRALCSRAPMRLRLSSRYISHVYIIPKVPIGSRRRLLPQAPRYIQRSSP